MNKTLSMKYYTVFLFCILFTVIFSGCPNPHNDYPGDDPAKEDPAAWYQYELINGDTEAKITGLSSAASAHLTALYVPSKTSAGLPVTVIGSNAFNGLHIIQPDIKTIVIPNPVRELEHHVFTVCHNVVRIDLPATLEIIGEGAFRDCAGLTEITIPASVHTMQNRAFSVCPELTTVTIPATSLLTTINFESFYACINLNAISIPDGVTSIQTRAFAYCQSLTSVTIPQKVTSISQEAFSACTGLSDVICDPLIPPALGPDVFVSNAAGRVIKVPAAAEALYKNDVDWNTYAADIVPQ